MFRNSLYGASISVLGLSMGVGGASAADLSPVTPSWSGFYAGIHVGLATGLESSLETSASASEQRSIGYCTNKGGQVVSNKTSSQDCVAEDLEWSWEEVEPAVDPVDATCSYKVGSTVTTATTPTATKQQCDALMVLSSGQCTFDGGTPFAAGKDGKCPSTTFKEGDPGSPAVYECEIDGKTAKEATSKEECETLAAAGKDTFTWNPEIFTDPVNSVAAIARDTADSDAQFLAGINAGYNYQHGRFVFGFEGDISALMDGRQSLQSSSFSSADADPLALDFIEDFNAEGKGKGGDIKGDFGLIDNSPTAIETSAAGDFGMSAFGTLRLRMGYAVNDRLLPFVTGGLAYGRISTKGSVTYSGTLDDGDERTNDAFSITRRFGDESWELGWTAGAGINYLVGERAVLGLTYLYTDLGTHKISDSYTAEATSENWGSIEDFSSVSGSVEGEVDARFHSLRASFTILFN